MRSKVAKRIQNETPEDVRIFVRQYTDIVIRINEILRAKGYTQKDLAIKLKKKPSEINKWLKGNHNNNQAFRYPRFLLLNDLPVCQQI